MQNMQPLQSNSNTTPRKQTNVTNNSILESFRDLSTGVGKSVAKDVVGKVASDAFNSLFGSTLGGDIKRSQPMVEAYPERQPFRTIKRPEVYQPMVAVHREEAGMKEKLESVRRELATLAASIKKFNSQVERAIDDIPAHPGIYHLNFLERLRGVIMAIRENIEDSNSWLSLWTTRKQKRKYWGMYKKHGTSFGLSSERNVSTQAG